MFRFMKFSLALVACVTGYKTGHTRELIVEPITLQGPKGIVQTVQFAPSGKLLASIHNRDTLAVWDVTKCSTLFTKKVPDIVRSISFSDDDKNLAISLKDSVEIFSTDTGKLKRSCPNFSLGVYHPRKQILALSSEKKLIFRDSDNNDHIIHDLREEKGIIAMVWSPNGESLCYITEKYHIFVYNMITESRIKIPDMDIKESGVDFTFSDDSKEVIILGILNFIKVFSLEKNKFSHEIKIDKKDFPFVLMSNSIVSKEIFFTGPFSPTCYRYNFRKSSVTEKINTQMLPNSIATSNDGKYLAIGLGEGFAEKLSSHKGIILLYKLTEK